MRGTGGNIIIAEEFAFMNSQFYNVVIVPILAAKAAFIGITTPGEQPTNFVRRLIDLKHPDGQPRFKTIRVEQVCDKCKRLNLAASCSHKIGEIPPWQDESRIDDIKEILKNDQETLMRETRGIASNYGTREVFDLEVVNAWKGRIYQAGVHAPYVYVSVDPNAGGMSEFSVVSAAFYNKSQYVVQFFCVKKVRHASTNALSPIDIILWACTADLRSSGASGCRDK